MNGFSRKSQGSKKIGAFLMLLYSGILTVGVARDAIACSVTEVTLEAKLEDLDWGSSVKACYDEEVSFKANIKVEEDTEERPIKCIFDFGDGNTETKWYDDDENEGPKDADTYSIQTSHNYDEISVKLTVKVRAQRWDPNAGTSGEAVNGQPEDDWPEATCEIPVLKIATVKHQEGSEWISGHVCVTKDTSVTFKAIADPSSVEWPTYRPKWSITGPGITGSYDDSGEELTYQYEELGVYTVKAWCCCDWFTIDRTVTVQDVVFVEDGAQSYGFDGYTDADHPWKSVGMGAGGADTAIAETAVTYTGNVYFKSLTTAKVTMSPSQASSSSQTLTFTGVSKGDSEIEANTEEENGDNLAKMGAAAYHAQTKTVRFYQIDLPGEDYDAPSWWNGDGLEEYLNDEVFNQCLTSFDVSFHPTVTEVDYDVDDDGKLTSGSSQETAVIRAEVRETAYEFHVYVVGGISGETALGTPVGGFADSPGENAYVLSTLGMNGVAHELGHALGALSDMLSPSGDCENLMSYYSGHSGTKLRKDQWDSCNEFDPAQ